MQNGELKLLSKLSLAITENDHHIRRYTSGKNPTHYFHYHDYYEIVFYLGEEPCAYRDGDTVYTLHRGDVAFYRMFNKHIVDCEMNDDHSRFNIGIEPRLLGNYSKRTSNLYLMFSEQNPHFPIFHLGEERLPKYLELLHEFLDLNNTPGQQIIASAILHYILGKLYCDMGLEAIQDSANLQHVRLVGSILHYIEENLSEPLSLQEIAQQYNYSVTYISKLFKNVTGSSLVSYIIEKRISRARHLMYENLEIMQIAEQVGYRNYSNFYKAFKKATGLSPEDYRHQLPGFTEQ